MHADIGDWLISKSHTEDQHTRQGEILAVRAGGQPPYTVRWLDDGRESLIFPGPDSDVMTATQRGDLHKIQAERYARIQAEIVSDHSTNHAPRP